MELPRGALFGGRWVVERPLSSGGMGAVYVAAHKETGRHVALKVIKVGDLVGPTAELVVRFQKETGALAAISHPNVVTFLDSGVENGTFYLVMELLTGRPLRAIMGPALEWQRAYRIAADVVRALAAVHQRGIVHRDLKPENVFLVDAVGHDEIAKLIDFGIARLEVPLENGAPSSLGTATRTGAIVGTPGYISPEQLQGHPATVASDVYAVGVILYELVTGRFPFQAPSTHAMLVKQLIDPLPPLRSVLPSVPAHVDELVTRFMARDPAQRTPTAHEALAQLLAPLRATPMQGLGPEAATEAAMPAAAFAPPSSGAAVVINVAPPDAVAARPTLATPMVVAPVVTVTAPAPEKQPRSAGSIVAMGCAGVGLLLALAVVIGVAGRAWRDDPRVPPVAPSVPLVAEDAVEDADVDTVEDDSPLLGRYGGVYSGWSELAGQRAPYATNATASVVPGEKPKELVLTFFVSNGSRCIVKLKRKGDGATFGKQSCTFTNTEGWTQKNTHSGKASLQGGVLVVDVHGTFAATRASMPTAKGTFGGRWILERE